MVGIGFDNPAIQQVESLVAIEKIGQFGVAGILSRQADLSAASSFSRFHSRLDWTEAVARRRSPCQVFSWAYLGEFPRVW